MTSIVQDIQFVHSLRKDIREPTLPSNILNSIETIHNCIKSGTDLNGWKKVEWRATGTNEISNTKNSNSGQRYVSNSGGQGFKRGNNGFFNGRQSNDQSSTPHYVFTNRVKSGFTGRQVVEPPTSIPLTNCTVAANDNTEGFRTVPQKYVSKFKKSSDKVEDTILNTILLGKLNKFSEQNYTEIKEFVTHIIDGGQTEMIKCFMKLVFEKAASEEMFCPLYAKLLSELSSKYPVLLTEMANLYSVYMTIFEEVNEDKAENYNEVCKQNIEKKYRRGYSQFLAELIKYNVIDNDIFMKTITTIIKQIEYSLKSKESVKLIEEYADCLNKVMKAIQEDVEYDSDEENDKNKMIEMIRQTLKNDMINSIQLLTVRNSENIGLSNKARFTFLDIYEAIQKF
jgi:signal recognition particle GTPase